MKCLKQIEGEKMSAKFKKEFDRLENIVTQNESKKLRFDRKTLRIRNHLKLLNELLRMPSALKLVFD